MTSQLARPVAPSVEALLSGATSRTPMRPQDGLSAVPMERVVLDGEAYVAKWLSAELDWVMRATGDTVCRPVLLWETGLYDQIAQWVDPLVVGAARDAATGECVLLMRDATGSFLPDGDAPIEAARQERILADMAALHAGTWGYGGMPGLCTPTQVYRIFSPENIEREADRGPLEGVPAYVQPGWEAVRAQHPALTERVLALASDPAPLVQALAQTPQALVHHDWKGGNLGHRPDGRTILVDWAFPGASAGCADLAWYLAVNCDRLPTSKESTISTYRDALERQGIATAEWFDRQLELALLGGFVLLGWSKADGPEELAWWVERVEATARELVG